MTKKILMREKEPSSRGVFQRPAKRIFIRQLMLNNSAFNSHLIMKKNGISCEIYRCSIKNPFNNCIIQRITRNIKLSVLRKSQTVNHV
ncbi:hypothetical protein RW64_20505 [Geobacter sulfurreducens]|nr:hypothetical protein RW64_20505 [Geobacter sulfurreducens]